jgi:hypothetical protein
MSLEGLAGYGWGFASGQQPAGRGCRQREADDEQKELDDGDVGHEMQPAAIPRKEGQVGTRDPQQ